MRAIDTVLRIMKDEIGAAAIEYGLLVALISVAIVGALQLTGTDLSRTFNTIANDL
jgi:pilus assembly protein Flp/PilA